MLRDSTAHRIPTHSFTYFVPRLLDFLWPGTNLLGAEDRRKEPEHRAGDKFRDTAEPRPAVGGTGSLTDSLELDELGAGEGGSNFRDNLKQWLHLCELMNKPLT